MVFSLFYWRLPATHQESLGVRPGIPGLGSVVGFAGGRVKWAGAVQLTGFGIRPVVSPKLT
jgi:hypothetical protein